MDGEGGPLADRALRVHGAAVVGHDGTDYGESEAGPSVGPRPRRVGPVEPFEDVGGLLRFHAGTVVGHRDHRAVTLWLHVDQGHGALGGVGPDIAQQVVDDLAEAGGVAHDLDGDGGVERDRPVRSHRGGGVHGFGAQRHEVHGALLHRPSLVQPGQQEEVGHQPLHPAGLVPDPAHQPFQVLLLLRGPATEELGVGGDGRDRGPQLVRGIGHEAPQAGLGRHQSPLRGHAGAEGRLDPGQHDIERPGQPTHLGRVVLTGHPFGQVAGGDRLGRRLHVAQRAQPPPDQPEPAEQGDDDGCPADGQFDEEEMVQGAVDVPERLGHDQPIAVAQHRGLHPEDGAAGLLGGRIDVGDLRSVVVGEPGELGGDVRGVGGSLDVGRAGLSADHGSRCGHHLLGLYLEGEGVPLAVPVPVRVTATSDGASGPVAGSRARGRGVEQAGTAALVGLERAAVVQVVGQARGLVELLVDPLVEERLQ